MDFKKIMYILFFFIAVLLINSIFGKKSTLYFLVLVIVGQLVVNADKITSLSNVEKVTKIFSQGGN